jgi:poly-gamma-glutamate capsule biosynthesis protein CapA/YwtB (metallophosphatase superfamily)
MSLTLLLAAFLAAAPADTLTLALSGDIMMGTTYPSVRLPEKDGATVFEDPAPVLRAATLAVGNLEGTLCDGGTSTKKPGKYNYAFRTPTSYAVRLSEAGYDFLSMANNHSNDFGTFGMASTETALDGQEIACAGVAGRREWAVVERSGVRFGLCAFGHNSYTLKHSNLAKVEEILDTLRKCSDIIVVSFHGGAEGSDRGHLPRGPETYLGENRGDLRNFAHFCIDHGASVVYGHGPHVTRCVEVYKGRFIAYSLGNFCTPYGINVSGVCGYAPVVTVRVLPDGRFVDGRIHPFIQQYGKGPKKDEKGIVTRHMKALSDADVPESEAIVLPDGAIRKK